MTGPLTVSPEAAASMLGIARSTFYERVLPDLRVIDLGRRRLVPVRELERWVEANASRVGN